MECGLNMPRYWCASGLDTKIATTAVRMMNGPPDEYTNEMPLLRIMLLNGIFNRSLGTRHEGLVHGTNRQVQLCPMNFELLIIPLARLDH